jgi:hypothetical protein
MAFMSLVAAIVSVASCGGSHNGDGNGGGGSTPNFQIGGSSSGATDGDGGVVCPSNLQCNVSCSGGGNTTTISGKVYDPAGRNPLYNIVVYVPATPLQALPGPGVPTGSAMCSCPALYPSGQVVTTTTSVDGTFTLSDAPVGDNVPLVVQIGKWRRQYTIKTTACQDNPQPDKSLTLPSTVTAGTDSMPEIAVSTGSADTLECLMRRIGLPTSEYVAGAGGSGHVHVFAGGETAAGGLGGILGGLGGGGGPGTPENPGMKNAPASYEKLWDSQADLMPYDIVLLSCEGGETYNANPPALESYLNVGGRVFASHYHYSWFAGPIGTKQNYAAPADWGNALASWTANGLTGPGTCSQQGATCTPIGGNIVTTLNGSTNAFPKGQALSSWLGNVNALGQNGVGPTELAIYQARYDAKVAAANTPSQPWITYDDTTTSPAALWTMYFSFDTPINPTNTMTNETGPTYCGRAVYSDLHVGGNPQTTDTMSPPDGCEDGPLSPQEKALEFMLFDLSSCVIPDSEVPPMNGIAPQ